jgi:hypothetical protein
MRHVKHPTPPGACFGQAPIAARSLAAGLGAAIARRDIFRAEDQGDFGRVADRVAAGNMALLGHGLQGVEQQEQAVAAVVQVALDHTVKLAARVDQVS